MMNPCTDPSHLTLSRSEVIHTCLFADKVLLFSKATTYFQQDLLLLDVYFHLLYRYLVTSGVGNAPGVGLVRGDLFPV